MATRFRAYVAPIWVGITMAACTRAPTVPAPTPTPPVAKLSVSIDGGARAAVPALSVVTADSSGSSGAERFQLDFGDGTIVTAANAQHVYTKDRQIFTVTLTATGADGLTASATASVPVTPVDVFWVSGGVSRVLSLNSRTGLDLSGEYSDDRVKFAPCSARLVAPRGIIIHVSDGTVIDGTQPNGFDSLAERFIASIQLPDGTRLNGISFAQPEINIVSGAR